ncbi:MAG: extracellular solute-binding protein [Spirochaetia bacterium]|jgi:multiple sugar transport system substrate-binding protein
MKRRSWATILIAALMMAAFAFPVFAAGGSEQASASGPGTLVYWSPFGGDSLKWDQWRVGEFEKANPGVKVNLVATPAGGVNTGKLLAAIAGGDAPDIALSDNASAAYSFAANGTAIPWDMSKITLKIPEMLPGMKEVTQIDGKTYLLPQDSNVIMLYMNVKVFKDAGLDVTKPPKTLDELDALAAKLDKYSATSIDRFGYIPWLDYGNDNPFYWGWMFGAKIFDTASKKLYLTEKPLVDVYRWMNKYAQKKGPTEMQAFTSGFGVLFSPDHPFMTGKVAMTVVGNWFTNALRIYAPNLEYAVAKVPTPAGGRAGGTTFQSNVFLLPKGAKRPDLAYRFYNFVITTPISANNFDIWRSIPTNNKQFDEVSWTMKNDPIYKIERELANSPNSGHAALTKVAAQLGNDLNALRDDVIYNNKDPLPLLEGLQDKFEKQLAQ